MAIITCPECGNKISNKAISCPICGCPASCFTNSQSSITENPQLKDSVPNKTELATEKKNKKCSKIRWLLFIFVLIIFAVIIKSSDYRYYWNKISRSLISDNARNLEKVEDWETIFQYNNGYLIFKIPYITQSVLPKEDKKPMYLVLHNTEGTKGTKGAAVVLGDYGNKVAIYYKYRFEITDEDVILMYRYDNNDRFQYGFRENINANIQRETKGYKNRRTYLVMDIQLKADDRSVRLKFDPHVQNSFNINSYNPEKWFK